MTETHDFSKDGYEADHVYYFQELGCPKFTLFSGNRNIDLSRVKSIADGIKSGLEKETQWIQVELRTGYIIDGQHRYHAFLKVWSEGYNIPIRIIFVDLGGDIKRIDEYLIKINNSSRKWSIKNYVKNYIEMGNSCYEKLEQFANSSKLLKRFKNKYVYAAMMINPEAGRRGNVSIKTGKFTCTDEAIDKAKILDEELVVIIDKVTDPRTDVIKRGGDFFTDRPDHYPDSLIESWVYWRNKNLKYVSEDKNEITVSTFLKKISYRNLSLPHENNKTQICDAFTGALQRIKEKIK